ncbi:MAG TPA: hypothetical protein VH008_02275 [Pseudonocardia sp.]|nr:hypothetical protein [Pseudonocardia sp.]
MPDRPADPMPDDELESYLAAISPDVDSAGSELTGRFGSAQVFQVRLPEARIEQLRRLAEAHGVPPTSLVVDWVLERLDREDPGFGTAVPRAPIAPRVHQPNPVGPVNPVEQPNPAGEPPSGPLGRTGGVPARPPLGQPSRPPAGRPARSSVGPLTTPATRPHHPLGSGPLSPASAPLPPPLTAPLARAAAALTEPALDPAASPLFPPRGPLPGAAEGPLSGPPPGQLSGTGSFATGSSFATGPVGNGILEDSSTGTGAFHAAAANPTSPSGEFAGPALANVPPSGRENSDTTDDAETSGAEASPVTPIFRAGSELPDPDKRRGPRHRAPEPVTSLLTRRKF